MSSPRFSLPRLVAAALLCVAGREAYADSLPMRAGAMVSGVLVTGEVKRWQLDTESGQYVRISLTAPDATLNAHLQDANGKSIQDSASIGGTGGAALLAWITGAPQYQLELKMVGDYPRKCNFRLKVEELRPAQPGEDPGQFPALAAADLLRNAQKRMLAKNFREALPLLGEALEAARKLGDPRLEGQALYRIAMAHHYLGERQSAVEFLQKALALQRASNQRFEIALTLNNLGAVELLLGSCRDSVDHLREALAIRQVQGDQRGVGYTLLALAGSYYCVGEAQESLNSDLGALRIWRDLKDEANEAETENTLGVVYLQMGDWENSRQSLNAALRRWRKAGNRAGEGKSTYNLGLLDAARGDRIAALAAEQQALAIFRAIQDRRGTAYALEARGQAYGKQENHDQALEDFKQARSILEQLGERYEEGYLWQALGTEYAALQRSGDARSAYDKALELEKQVGDGQGQAVTLFQFAQLETETGNRTAALLKADQAIALVEESRKEVLDPAHRASYLATKRDIYALKVSLLTRAGDCAGAFETSDAAHARSLLDEVSQGSGTDARTKSPYPKLAKLGLAKLEQVQALLDGDGVLIEYLVNGRQGYGWAITRTGITGFSIPSGPQLEPVVRELYVALTARNRSVANENLESRAQRIASAHVLAQDAAKRLSTMLFGTLPTSFRRRRMLIVPDGPLYLVPFSLLPFSAQAEVVESPSASVFLAKHAGPHPTSLTPVLVVANPEVHSGGFPPLEFSGREAIALAHFVKPSQLEIREREKATSSMFVHEDLTQFGLIHIAAHAVVDMHHPGQSGVILSDGKIDANSIMKLNVHARLVTLSACDTALGKEIEGEGIMSLSRAFLYAGARTVLSTLWPVDDQATSVFMEQLYTALLTKRRTVSEALRDAQLQMRANPAWRDPYYWAAFTLQGDWQ